MPRIALLVPSTAVALLLAACGGSGSTADSPVVAPASGAGSGAPSAAASAGSHPAHGAGSKPSTAASAHAAGGSRAASAAPSASGAAAGGRTAAAGGVPLPPTGSYTYSIHGSSKSALGSQSLDGDSSLVVQALSGNRERSTQKDKGGSTTETMVAGKSGLYLADIHLSQTGFDEDFQPAKPVLLFPGSPHQGQDWQWQMTSTDGKYTLTAQLSITDLHSSATTTQGKRYDTVTLSTVLHLHSSDIDLTIHQVDQASRDAVIVHEHSVSDGTAYGTHFHSDATRVLAKRPG